MVRRRRRRFRRIFILLLLLLGGLAAFLIQTRFNPIVRELGITQVKNQTSDLINDAIAEQIARDNIQYDRIIYFEKDLQGRITALKTNMSEVNRLKTDILNIINDEIMALDTHDIGIPLGSVVFPEVMSGKRPVLPVGVVSISNSDGQVVSHFSQAGINQTLQQLTMEVSVDVTILVLSETVTFNVMSQVVVAETIIVGEVPDTFLSAGDFFTP